MTDRVRQTINDLGYIDDAEVSYDIDQRPIHSRIIELDLTTKRTKDNAYQITLPCRSIRFESSDDPTISVGLVPGVNKEGNDPIALTVGASVNFGKKVSTVHVVNESHPGIKVKLLVLTDSKIDTSEVIISQGHNTVPYYTAARHSQHRMNFATVDRSASDLPDNFIDYLPHKTVIPYEDPFHRRVLEFLVMQNDTVGNHTGTVNSWFPRFFWNGIMLSYHDYDVRSEARNGFYLRFRYWEDAEDAFSAGGIRSGADARVEMNRNHLNHLWTILNNFNDMIPLGKVNTGNQYVNAYTVRFQNNPRYDMPVSSQYISVNQLTNKEIIINNNRPLYIYNFNILPRPAQLWWANNTDGGIWPRINVIEEGN